MGAYISQTTLELHWGADNVAQWSNLGNTTLNGSTVAADTSRIDEAIALGEGLIESRFRDSRYTLPLSGSASSMAVVRRWMSVVSKVMLYRGRGTQDEVSARVELEMTQVMQEIDTYLSGQRRIDLSLARNQAGCPTVV
jgi:hypothetical protein